MTCFTTILRNLLATFLLLLNTLHAQDAGSMIRQKAINCEDFSVFNASLYASLKNYKCISIGGMHGTEEPAALLAYLTKLFAADHKRVIVGIEIPETTMAKFIAQQDSSHLAQSEFFSGNNGHGRASKAWFNALNACNRLGVDFCFFDSYSDSTMYLQLLKQYRNDTSAIILTLSNTSHNSFNPNGTGNTMGFYLNNFFGKQFCSINHIFGGGTMYHHSSHGLELYEFPPVNQVFANATHYSSYFIPNTFGAANSCSAYFYTQKVTASLPYNADLAADKLAAKTP